MPDVCARLAQAGACIDRGDWHAAAEALAAYDAALRAAVAAGALRDAAQVAEILALHGALQLKLASLRADTLAQIETLARERSAAQRCLSAYAA